MPHWEKASRIKTARVWWPAPRCTTWWSNQNEEQVNLNVVEECRIINDEHYLDGRNDAERHQGVSVIHTQDGVIKHPGQIDIVQPSDLSREVQQIEPASTSIDDQPVTVGDQSLTVHDRIPFDKGTYGNNTDKIHTATFQTGHRWLQMVSEIENKRLETMRKKRADRLREKWKTKINGIMMSSDKYLTKKNMNKQNLAKNCPMSPYTCP